MVARNMVTLPHTLTFAPPVQLQLRRRTNHRKKACMPFWKASSISQPRIVVLPGMDGTDLLLDPFRRATSSPDDPNRVIAVNYPFDKPLTVAELGAFVVEEYLSGLADDPRGYIIANQSLSGHVGLHLSQCHTPGILHGQVFVNAFLSPPAPSFLRRIPASITDFLFRNQPPPWLVGTIFLGPNAPNMDAVQAAASQVLPAVMTHRLSLCLTENSWHVWRCRDSLPGEHTLYLRGDDDVIVRDDDARQVKLARPDIEWVYIAGGPHLLLQRYGTQAGDAVNEFCKRFVREEFVAS